MNLRLALLLCVLSALIGGAVTEKYLVQTKTVTVDHEVIKDNIVTVTHTITQPNGTVESTTTTTDKSDKLVSDVNTAVVASTHSTLNISALVANDFSRGVLVPTYGVSVSKQLLGPVTVGGFGLTNGTIGISIGINF
jgi:hypothetical protein